MGELAENIPASTPLPKITTTTYDANNNNKDNTILNENNVTPNIEIATYAETDVYECYLKGLESNVVMRRVKDDWVNVTQVFKLAKFPKTRRSKILEREVTFLKHEKVQGGYGRFQGTWVSLGDAKKLINQYNISNVVVNYIVNFVPDKNNPPKKRVKNSVLRRSSPGGKISSPSSYNKTPKKKKVKNQLLSAASTSEGVNYKSNSAFKLRNNNSFQGNPSPLHNVAFQTPQQNQFNVVASAEIFEPRSTKPILGMNNTNHNATVPRMNTNNVPLPQNYSASTKPLQFFPVPTMINNKPQLQSIPTNKFQSTPNFNPPNSVPLPHQYTIPEDQSIILKNYSPPHAQISPINSEVQTFNFVSHDRYRELILETLAVEITKERNCVLPDELYHPPPDFDINFEVDGQNNRPLHWAAAMANIPLLNLLLNLNADTNICNANGFNCLTKAIFYNNNYKCDTFYQLLFILKPCLVMQDINGRLPIHYLVELSVNPSKDATIIATYTEQILQEIQKMGEKSLVRFLNHQDSIGNSVMHLAALNGNVSLFNKFYMLGGYADTINMDNQTPLEILSQLDYAFSNSPVEYTLQAPNIPEVQSQKNTPAIMKEDKNIGTPLSPFAHQPVTTQERHNATKNITTMNDNATDNNSSIYMTSADISTIENMITSPARKSMKSVGQTLLNSPMIQLRARDDNTKALYKVPISPSPRKKIGKDINQSKLGSRISNVSRRLVDAINEDVEKYASKIYDVEENLSALEKNLKSATKKNNQLLGSANVTSMGQLYNKVHSLQKTLDDDKKFFMGKIEKTQALQLASLVQEEEEKEITSPKEDKDALLRQVVTLTVLQFKRRMWLKRACEELCNHTSTEKIEKYKHLIGMTFDNDNIDGKLEEIEIELQTNA